MKTKLLIAVATMALIASAPGAQAAVQFIYSYQGSPVLVAAPGGVWGSELVWTPFGSTSFYASHGDLSLSSGYAAFSGYRFEEAVSPPPPPLDPAFAYWWGVISTSSTISVSHQTFDPSIPATVGASFTLTTPGGFPEVIEIDAYAVYYTVFYNWDGPGTPVIPIYDVEFIPSVAFIQFDQLTISNVPEPSSWLLMLTGFAGLGCYARRRQHRTAVARVAPRSRSQPGPLA
jgi:hypothetical protein